MVELTWGHTWHRASKEGNALVVSRHLTFLSLLKNPTPASKDCRLTFDLDQNLGLLPITHSILITFKNWTDIGYSHICEIAI